MTKIDEKYIKLALICTAGGHFEQLNNLQNFYHNYDRFWITNKNSQTESALVNEQRYFINAAHFKKPWTYLAHFPQIYKIFKQEKPTHIISTGSGRTAFIPFILAKILGVQFIYIETYSRVNNLTLLAKFLLRLGHPVQTQWKTNINGTNYIGPVVNQTDLPQQSETQDDYIFVTLGTRGESFKRLLSYVNDLKKGGIIHHRVVVQAGHTAYRSDYMEVFDFCPVDRIDELIRGAAYIITQESAGIGSKCLKFNKRFIVMPRDYQYGELPAKSDMKEDLQYHLEELGYTRVVQNIEELKIAIESIEQLKTGFKFDNSLSVATLKEIVEK